MPQPEPEKNGRRNRWVWTVLPVNGGITAFNTMLPLYILQLGGTVIDVALLTTIYNVMLIPSSIFWGSVTDRLSRRRLFFIISYVGIAAIFGLMLLLQNIYWLAFLYGWLAYAVVANAAASNLLVMETTAKRSWVSSYARLSLTGNLGAIIGLMIGLFWSSILPLRDFLAFCSVSSLVSLGLAFAFVREPELPLETIQLAFQPLGFFSRLSQTVTSTLQGLTSRFTSPPSPREIVRIFRAARAGAIEGRTLLFISTFIFMIGSALLNTSYTPFLAVNGVLANQVFALHLVNSVIQTAVYRWMGIFTSRFGEIRVGSYAVVVRSVVYALIAASGVLFQGFPLFLFSTVMFALIGVVFALWNASTSGLLLNSLGPARQGGMLGGYSALSSLGLVVGSFFSGYASFYLGYVATFIVAAVLLIVSFFVLEAAFRGLGVVPGRTTR